MSAHAAATFHPLFGCDMMARAVERSCGGKPHLRLMRGRTFGFDMRARAAASRTYGMHGGAAWKR